ncbi:winged helix-turn-helix transcriptional regulator [Candidatus Bathyarchaeota archaeon]|nr:MAG: winged helix-turn-helix transcriptional regulator [Candidatus Bathyarchaeota archaeon]TMI30198.1 MAG: winged helix-turn-helix transcriptional regulator [Candidatus Bathyarchaeota archaeon]
MSPAYHPRAYMTGMRNVSRGLTSRTKILETMEQGRTRISEISEKSKLGPACVSYHLKLMLQQKIVHVVQTGREGRWTPTKYGQEKLFT